MQDNHYLRTQVMHACATISGFGVLLFGVGSALAGIFIIGALWPFLSGEVGLLVLAVLAVPGLTIGYLLVDNHGAHVLRATWTVVAVTGMLAGFGCFVVTERLTASVLDASALAFVPFAVGVLSGTRFGWMLYQEHRSLPDNVVRLDARRRQAKLLAKAA